MNIIKGLLTEEMLYRAWEKVRMNRKTSGIDRQNAENFEEDLDENIAAISRELAEGTYRPRPAKLVIIPKENGKTRPLTILCLRDKLVQTAVMFYLDFIFRPAYSDYCFGFVRNRRISSAISYIVSRLREGFRYFVKADIDNFFPSIDRPLLLKILEGRGVHPGAVRLIEMWSSAGYYHNGKLYSQPKGIPQGSPLSPTLSNIYLMDFDRAAEEQGIPIARYADDMLILARDRDDGYEKLNFLQRNLISERHIKFNPGKIIINSVREGIEFLGKKIVVRC